MSGRGEEGEWRSIKSQASVICTAAGLPPCMAETESGHIVTLWWKIPQMFPWTALGLCFSMEFTSKIFSNTCFLWGTPEDGKKIGKDSRTMAVIIWRFASGEDSQECLPCAKLLLLFGILWLLVDMNMALWHCPWYKDSHLQRTADLEQPIWERIQTEEKMLKMEHEEKPCT